MAGNRGRASAASPLGPRIGIGVQITCLRGQLELLGDPVRATPRALSARLALIRQHIEIAERHLAALSD